MLNKRSIFLLVAMLIVGSTLFSDSINNNSAQGTILLENYHFCGEELL